MRTIVVLNLSNIRSQDYYFTFLTSDVNKAEAVSGCTALHIACNDNNVVAVRALCGHPALRHNQTSHAGDTPLMLAVIQVGVNHLNH